MCRRVGRIRAAALNGGVQQHRTIHNLYATSPRPVRPVPRSIWGQTLQPVRLPIRVAAVNVVRMDELRRVSAGRRAQHVLLADARVDGALHAAVPEPLLGVDVQLDRLQQGRVAHAAHEPSDAVVKIVPLLV